MEEQLDKKVAELKDQLQRGDYTVDPDAVADAILRRLRDLVAFRVELVDDAESSSSPPFQSRCSYPVSGADLSAKLTPEPRIARPIQVIRAAGEALVSAASSVARAGGGAQTQSS
jgi:hypothetical protein